jgi:hexosaminidase
MNLLPLPRSVQNRPGTFRLTGRTPVIASPDLQPLAASLARALSSGPDPLPLGTGSPDLPAVRLELNPEITEAEGYRLEVEPGGILLQACAPAGLFWALQTLLQLLPVRPLLPVTIDCVRIQDAPRHAWRGLMLDVARHFFPLEDIKRLIDLAALYKFNVLHLHLTDDQGWRLEIRSWPKLAEVGGSTATHGDPGGYYTQAQYRELVAYAAGRCMTVIPEIDLPSHTQAAIAACPELGGISKHAGLYTGTEVGFSTLDVHKEITYRFIQDVLGELAALTPGPYLHIGGDEAHSTPDTDYIPFIERVQEIVRKLGKQPLGWEEIGKARLLPETVVQYWWNETVTRQAAAQGNRLVISPARHAYLDIKYDAATRLGQDWTRSYVEVRDSYAWDPLSVLPGLPPGQILGVEAPLWTETIVSRDDMDAMFFPRLCAIAEVGWTDAGRREWQDFRRRLSAHGPRLTSLGVRYHPSAQIDWQNEA